MPREYGTILTEVFSDVLMNYAFMFGEICPKDELPVNGAHYLHATVGFSGHLSGVHGISASSDLCVQLAANVLGVEPDDGDSIDGASDALEELINIVCGQFLTRAFGEKPIFDLSPPAVLKIDEAEWRSLIDNDETIGFMIDDIPAIIYVSLTSV